jgi:hypothetical protein
MKEIVSGRIVQWYKDWAQIVSINKSLSQVEVGSSSIMDSLRTHC